MRDFINKHFRHFNAAAVKEAAQGYVAQMEKGHKMMVTLAGAMSTAEMGILLAEMIRQDKIHAISCTAANLEEDLFNLVAHEQYERIPHYKELSAEQELALLKRGLNRVTDTCIPEEAAIFLLDKNLHEFWKKADQEGQRYFPHEYFYQLIQSEKLKPHYQTDPKNSWLVAAYEKNLPIYVPGWEDSSLGNAFVGHVRRGEIQSYQTVKSGLEYMDHLIDYYLELSQTSRIGFFQIGGGIAGDFPICVVPLIRQELDKKENEAPLWSYFCQIGDSTTSYGSYSGAVPNEKITWCKLGVETPKYMIESDATIVAPLIFAYVLDKL